MNSEILKQGLTTIVGSTTSPILFVVKDNLLILGGHNETCTVIIETKLQDTVDDLHFVLPKEHASQIIKILKSGTVTISGQDEEMSLKSGRTNLKFSTMPIESISYKLLTHKYSDDFFAKVDSREFAKALSSVLDFSGKSVEDVRAKNIHLAIEDGFVEVAASNSFTVAKYVFPVDESTKDIPLKIVAKSLAFLTRTFGEKLDIGVKDKVIFFRGVDSNFTYKVTVPLIDSPVFPYRNLFESLEKEKSIDIIAPKDTVLEEAKNLIFFTSEELRNRVFMQFDSNNIYITGSNDKGNFDTQIPLISSNGEGELYVSLDYLNKAASSISTPELRLKYINGKLLLTDNRFSVIVPSLRN